MQPANIWLPPSYLYREAHAVDKAVNQYDPELHFGRNERNGQWCIFMERHSERIPVLGFRDIPHPDDALKRLYKADTRRHGSKILDDLIKHNEETKAAGRSAGDDAVGQTAEAFEYAYRKEGLHPTPRIFVPGRD